MKRVINSGVLFAIYLQDEIKYYRIPHRSVDKTCDAWIVVRNGELIMLNKSLEYSLTDTLSYYYFSKTLSCQGPQQYFLKLICSNCSNVAVYLEPANIPPCDEFGQLVCPHCQKSWLIYR